MLDRAASSFQPEEMQLLAWKFLDGCASHDEQQQLTGCLSQHEAARAVYLKCVQLHVDLLSHFGSLPAPKVIENGSTKFAAKLATPAPVHVVSPLPLMNAATPF